MTQVSINIDGIDEGVKEALEVFPDAEDAFYGGIYEGTQVLMDRWQKGVWVDTGALRDSNFVTKPRGTQPQRESVAGYVAPYANIVERTHPTNRFYLSRTFSRNIGDINRVIGETTANLYNSGGGISNVPQRYPTKGTFKPRIRNTQRRRFTR